MGTVKVRRAFAGTVVAGLLVAGCSDADGELEPPSGPTVTQSPSESPSATKPTAPAPGPTPWPEPTRPAAMERDDVEGAKAAAEYFLSLHPYIFATGDLRGWKTISHPECEFCQGAADHVSGLFAEGGYGAGGEFVIDGIEASRVDKEQSRYIVDVSGVEQSSQEHSGQGEEISNFEGGAIAYNIAVEMQGEGWVIRGVSWEE